MATNDAPKSSYELAMEKLRKKDAEEGIEQKPLTDEQKAAIAEIRSTYEAKLAQEQIMHHSELARVFEPSEREVLEDGYRRDRERLSAERDSKIERVRAQSNV